MRPASNEVGKGHHDLPRLPIRASSICCWIRHALPMPPRAHHLDSCAACSEEFESLAATFALLDAWKAPEPSPYFDQKLAVRLREEQAMAPAGWFERMRSRLLFNTGRQFRPALRVLWRLLLVVGGGTFANFTDFSHQTLRSRPQCRTCKFSIKMIRPCRRWISSCRMLGSTEDPSEPPSS